VPWSKLCLTLCAHMSPSVGLAEQAALVAAGWGMRVGGRRPVGATSEHCRRGRYRGVSCTQVASNSALRIVGSESRTHSVVRAVRFLRLDGIVPLSELLETARNPETLWAGDLSSSCDRARQFGA
jgi:hypothetical protein